MTFTIENQKHSEKEAGHEQVAYDNFPVSGNFGTVFQVKVESTGEIVAIKRILLERKFKNRELQILSSLNHPNIPRLYHYFYSKGNTPDRMFVNLVMEYMPFTLYKIIRYLSKQGKVLSPSFIRSFSFQLLNALSCVHNAGIVHRDVKLQNILISPPDNSSKNSSPPTSSISLFSSSPQCQNVGRLALCDFGSAKYVKKGEPSVCYICSRFYRAPELILGATEYSYPIDMWSFGCVLGELMLGHPLFPGETTSDQFYEIVKVLGTPSDEDLVGMNVKRRIGNPSNSTKKCKLPPFSSSSSTISTSFLSSISSQELTLPPIPPLSIHGFRLLFRSGTDSAAIDLLQHVLVYNPERRPTATECLKHKFFSFEPS